MAASKGKYPAPPAILECAKAGLESGHAAGSKVRPPAESICCQVPRVDGSPLSVCVVKMQLERELFGKLSASRESAALRGLFFGQTASKKNSFGSPTLKVCYLERAHHGYGTERCLLMCRWRRLQC